MLRLGKRSRQRTFCYCPICGNELVGSDSFISDTTLVLYHCTKCGCLSQWDFDLFPFPVIVKSQKLTSRLYEYRSKS